MFNKIITHPPQTKLVTAMQIAFMFFVFTASSTAYGAKYNSSAILGIPSNSVPLETTINIDSLEVVETTDINIGVNIAHPDTGTLTINLVAPNGTVIPLSTNNGSGSDFTNTVFDEEAGTSITAGSSPFTGNYQPEGLLSDFYSALNAPINLSGIWTLQVIDNSTNQTGNLTGWYIDLPSTTTYRDTDIPVNLQGASVISSTITINATGQVSDINVGIDITHERNDELYIYLFSPDFTWIELSLSNGGKNNNYIATVFDDSAVDAISAGTAPFTGTYKPEEPLSNVNGESIKGVWSLFIYDNFGAGEPSGTLNSWYMELTDSALVAQNDYLVTNEDTTTPGTLFAEDEDTNNTLTYSIVSNGSNGTATITNSLTGEYEYTPSGGYVGTDSFTYKVNNGSMDSNIAVVDVNVLSATALDVLLIWDELNIHTQSLVTALTSSGITVTLSETSEGNYDGSNPSPTHFDAVIHLNGTNVEKKMHSRGGGALDDYVQSGGGFIHNEWNTYETAIKGLNLRNITLFDREGSGRGDITIDLVPGVSHPVTANIPVSGTTLPYTFSSGYNKGTKYENESSIYPIEVLMTDAEGNDAVAVKEYGWGRVVGFHHAGNYFGSTSLSDPNVQQLYIDGVLWAKKDIVTVTPPGLSITRADIDLPGVERNDGGNDSNNIDTATGNPTNGLKYIFAIALKDNTSGTSSSSAKVYIATKDKSVATTSDFRPTELNCVGDITVKAICSVPLFLGPAANYSIYFEGEYKDGTISTYPAIATTGTYLDGPTIGLLNGYNTVGIPKDLPVLGDTIPTTPLYGTEAFTTNMSYRWMSSGLGSSNPGFYQEIDGSGSPVTAGEGYFIFKGVNTTLENFDVYTDITTTSFTTGYLKPGWNLISNPYPNLVKTYTMKFTKDSGWNGVWTQAVNAGYVRNSIYYYDGSQWGLTYSMEVATNSTTSLSPWMGYWIYLNSEDTDIRLTITKP